MRRFHFLSAQLFLLRFILAAGIVVFLFPSSFFLFKFARRLRLLLDDVAFLLPVLGIQHLHPGPPPKNFLMFFFESPTNRPSAVPNLGSS